MGTSIDIDYTRKFQNADVQAIVGRGNLTTSVLVQLGTDYQSLPAMALAGYQTEVTALAGQLTLLNSLIDQIRPVLVNIDDLARPLHEKNIRALGVLRNALRNDADVSLLDQITGPTTQSSTSPPTPTSPPPPTGP